MFRKDLAWYDQLLRQFRSGNENYLYDFKNKISYHIMEKSDIAEASRISAQCMASNPFYRIISMSADEYLEDSTFSCQESVKSRIGCIARNSQGQMIGVHVAYSLSTAINVTHGQESYDRCGSKLVPLLNALVELFKTTPWHQYGGIDRIVYLDEVSVLKNASGKGVGYILPEFALVLAERKGYTHAAAITVHKITKNDLDMLPNWKEINSIEVASITGNDGKERVYESISKNGFRSISLYVGVLNPSKL
ncbi:hypothetical protein TrispH2_010275 [Trichoplax sp. H2]|nr:hypothetical protein TrispH2_010275 [Trichoplax sp. H2]|eukprot:RDD37330.1 hypothetical protein TrispH2_010275 [Trichoplax sp. H2]